MERIYNKLVRDNIPEIIKSKGEVPVIRKLETKEYKQQLEKKLIEECNEVIQADGKDRIEELADALEVIKALAKLENATLDDVETIAQNKATKRGAFELKIFLEKVITKN